MLLMSGDFKFHSLYVKGIFLEIILLPSWKRKYSIFFLNIFSMEYVYLLSDWILFLNLFGIKFVVVVVVEYMYMHSKHVAKCVSEN
jgi:hypothetical protein